jgi:selenoprotein W-related protein
VTEALLAEHQWSVESWELVPSSGGRFEVELDGDLVFSKLQEKRHPTAAELDTLVRLHLDQAGAGR